MAVEQKIKGLMLMRSRSKSDMMSNGNGSGNIYGSGGKSTDSVYNFGCHMTTPAGINGSPPTSSSSTVITIEADERTPLLLGYGQRRQRRQNFFKIFNGKRSTGSSAAKTPQKRLVAASVVYAECEKLRESNGSPRAEVNRGQSQSQSQSPSSSSSPMCDCRVLTIGGISITGIIIAIYLLVIECRSPSMKFSLDLINRDAWNKVSIPLGGLLNHSAIINVIITHTGGSQCVNPDECIQRLRAMQINQTDGMEIPYNFLIGSDGQTYEIRGWDHESGAQGIPQKTSLLIGFIGDYTLTAPSDQQLQSAWSLIIESVRRKKLQRDYSIYGLRNANVSLADGEALFRSINAWPRFVKLMDDVSPQQGGGGEGGE